MPSEKPTSSRNIRGGSERTPVSRHSMPHRERVDTAEELLAEEDETASSGADQLVAEPGANKTDTRDATEATTSRAEPESMANEEASEDEGEDATSEPSSDANAEPAEPTPARISWREWLSRFGRNEWIALGGVLLVVIVGAALFFKFLYGGVAANTGEKPARALSFPLKGKLAKLARVEHSWRERQPGDSGRAEFIILPQVSLTIDPAASSSGYVRVIFTDPDGRTRGDVMSVKFEGGRFRNSNRGEHISADGAQVALACTEGFESTTLFRAYLGNEEPRWTLRIEEGADYSKGPWTTLGFVEIRNEKK